MKLLHSLLALSGLSALCANHSPRAVEIPHKGPTNMPKGKELANLQTSYRKRGKKRRGKYAMPENYDSTPPLSRLPINQIHPRQFRDSECVRRFAH